MTETNGAAAVKEEVKDAPVDKKPASPAKILRQVEHYFGDYNLPRDKFLLETIKASEGGWVDTETMFKFQRLAAMTTDAQELRAAIKESKVVEMDEEATKIRRLPSLEIPEWNDERKAEMAKATVYVKGFDKENTTLDELLENFKYDGCLNISLRTYLNKKDQSRGFKGSVFMTFGDRAGAEAFMKLEKVEYKGVELERKYQDDYLEEKKKEFEAKKKEKIDAKKKIKAAKEVIDAQKEKAKKEEPAEMQLPKGSVMVVTGLNDDTMREDIKSRLEELYDSPPEAIAYVYYQKGESEAKLRFKEENAAVELVKKVAEKPLTVKEAEVKVTALEGEEEEAFLKQCVADMAERRSNSSGRGHKRKAFGRGGGRGGKRGRHH